MLKNIQNTPTLTKLFFPGRGYSIGVRDFVQELVKALLLQCRTLLKATSLVCTIYSVYISFYYEYKKRNTCNIYLCAIGIRARYHHIKLNTTVTKVNVLRRACLSSCVPVCLTAGLSVYLSAFL